jgi:hypothetical protein
MAKRYIKNGSGGKRTRSERTRRPDKPQGRVQLVLDREELVAMMQGCLTEFATEVGLKVACLLLEEEAGVLGGHVPPPRNGACRPLSKVRVKAGRNR